MLLMATPMSLGNCIVDLSLACENTVSILWMHSCSHLKGIDLHELVKYTSGLWFSLNGNMHRGLVDYIKKKIIPIATCTLN